MSHRVLGEPPEASPTPLAKKQKTALRAFFISSWLGLQDVIRNPAKYEEDMKNVLYIAYGLGITEA